MRSDAIRNRERILTAAGTVYAERGVDVPFDDVARAAGVGNATLYRNFPTREHLLAEVLQEQHAELRSLGEELAGSDDPLGALRHWLVRFVDYASTYDGLPGPIAATLRDPASQLYESCRAMYAQGAELLTRAQEAGVVRDDRDAVDLFVHASGIAWAAGRGPADDPLHEQRADRAIEVVLAGLGSVRGRPASGPRGRRGTTAGAAGRRR